MDSIAERIGLCSHCLTDETRFCHTDCFHYERYKEAVKQRNIDIEKACEWLANPSNDYFPMIKKGWQEAFRKAMEE